MTRLIIFTDLDGTLLDHATYSYDKALPALETVRLHRIPLIICSSKTKTEIELYRRRIGNTDPFVSENGGGIFLPKGYFGSNELPSGLLVETGDDYALIRLGARYSDIRRAVEELRNDGFPIRGFGDMTTEEVSAVTNLNPNEAAMAKVRDFDEPFLFTGDDESTARLHAAIRNKGFTVTQGRFHHILGESDKGRAVSIVKGLFERRFGKVYAVALGDSPNDLPMLEAADYPVAVQKPDGRCDPRLTVPSLVKADGIGPAGWNSAILSLIQNFSG